MTIDERIQFLLQSTESLHSNMQELHASMQELREASAKQGGSIQELIRLATIDGENISRLATIAQSHSA